MTIKAEASDGTIHEFPDGTHPSVIDATMKKYAASINTPAPEPKGAVDEIMQGPVGRFGVNVAKGAMQLPGLPVEAIVGGGNFVRRQLGLPERPLEETVGKDWGFKGWGDFAERNLGKPNIAPPEGDVERIADKAGQFVGGGLPFGPAGLIPSLAATAGSEVGRATDQAGLTNGYGETAGALLGGATPGLVRGVTTAGLRGAPTIEQIRDAGTKAYAKADQAGVIVPPTGMRGLADDAKAIAADFGYDPALQPGVGAVLKRLEDATGGNITLKGIDQIRKVASNAARDTTNASQRELSGRLIDRIDDFIDKLEPQDVLSGDPKLAAAYLKQARSHWQRLRKSEMIDEALGRADRRAASTNSGGNVDNATRQNIRGILDNPKKARMFTPKEKALMERVVRGTTGQNALRLIGKLSPEGSGLMGIFGIGATYSTGGVGAAPFVAGYAAKKIADALTKRNANVLSEAVRNGQSGRQATNAKLLELLRRAQLAGQSTLPALPGALSQQP